MKKIAAVILAAGEGTRMKSAQPKVLHEVCGKPMLRYMLELIAELNINRSIVVVGHRADKIRTALRNHRIQSVQQAKLLGSADAVWQTRKTFSGFNGDLLVVYGDTPLISRQSLKQLIRTHQANRAACTVLTAVTSDPTGFGRILRDRDNKIVKIIEEQDADIYEQAIGEINVGAYCFKAKNLFSALKEIKPNNAKKEYYLTDVIEVLSARKAKIKNVYTQNEQEGLGVNSRRDLSRANAVINSRKIEDLSAQGVTILDPQTTFLHGDVRIGQDTIIYPHTVIEGRVRIGKSCRIGPFARLRDATVLGQGVQIGNFVEIARSKIGQQSKIKHHSYIGDALVGKKVNIGAGVITANYDGKNKNQTVIADEAFVGVGAILIAPVKIGKGAVVGAGSVVTKNKNVPAGATVIGAPARLLKSKAGAPVRVLKKR
ncbi:bifunctional N-acetylglucosamine-1-phosphate uridyltransferase/glucosamine-1-phosphate acetyltransferase [Candidatus Omnitrophota bacterium]